MMKMMSKALAVAVVGGIAALNPVSPAAAHHSFAMFDQKTELQKSNVTVKEFRWTNPHSFVVIETKDAKGTTQYTLECSSPNMMSHAGWKASTIKTGDKVDVLFYPLRDGRPGGMLKSITLADGKTLKGW